MQSKDVQIGKIYWAKVSGRSVKARIESVYGNGWKATNLNSGRKATIKSVVNLDEIVEGRNVHADRKLKIEREEIAKQMQQLDVKGAIATYFAVEANRIKSIVCKPLELKFEVTSTKGKVHDVDFDTIRAIAAKSVKATKKAEANKDIKSAIAEYLKIDREMIAYVKDCPVSQSYDVDLKDGKLFEVTYQELTEIQSEKKTKVVKESNKPAAVDRNRLPKSRKITSIPPVKKENIKPIRKGTKQQAIAEALLKGATIDDLCKVTGWDRKSAHGQVHGGLSNRKGYGINQKGDKYYLVFPEGLNELVYA